jgi:hypothetical protein
MRLPSPDVTVYIFSEVMYSCIDFIALRQNGNATQSACRNLTWGRWREDHASGWK